LYREIPELNKKKYLVQCSYTKVVRQRACEKCGLRFLDVLNQVHPYCAYKIGAYIRRGSIYK
jgi:hypothetical protein